MNEYIKQICTQWYSLLSGRFDVNVTKLQVKIYLIKVHSYNIYISKLREPYMFISLLTHGRIRVVGLNHTVFTIIIKLNYSKNKPTPLVEH